MDYKNTQSILAEYAEYSATMGKFGAKAGLRYEHTWEKVNFIVGSGSDFKKNYGSLVPSASFSYNISGGVNLGLNYNIAHQPVRVLVTSIRMSIVLIQQS